MSQPNGEVVSLSDAIDKATGWERSFRAAMSSLETTIAGLAAGGTSGAAIAHFTAMMENVTQGAQNAALAKATLTSHLTVKESYLAAPGAGKREFVTAD